MPLSQIDTFTVSRFSILDERGAVDTELEPGTGHEAISWAAPATRRLARELGADIRRVAATGPAGRVLSDDVRLHAQGSNTSNDLPRPPGVPNAADTCADPSAAARTQTVRAPCFTPGVPDPSAGRGHLPIPYLELEPVPDFLPLSEPLMEAAESAMGSAVHVAGRR